MLGTKTLRQIGLATQNGLTLLLLLSLVFFTVKPPVVNAVAKSDLNSLINRRPFYNPTDDCDSSVGTVSSAVTQSAATPGPVFLLGDSIGEGLAATLGSALPADAGWSVTANTRVSRPLSEGISVASSKPAGLADAKSVLVVLGTNPDSAKNNTAGINELVETIRKAPTSAPIYWLKVNVTNTDLTANMNAFNSALDSATGITVLNNTVAPTRPDGTHYQDYTPLAQSVAGQLQSPGSITSNASGSVCAQCSTGGTGTVPADGENPKRMFEYLLSQGLTAQQAAGVTGNAMAESGPNIDPAANSPSGYTGIFQWDTGGRWARLVEWANSQSKDPQLFEVQLEYAWKEAGERNNIEGIKQQNSIELATWYWGRFYEVAIVGGSTSTEPLTNVQHLDTRTNYARSVFDQYGGSSAGSTSAPASSCGAVGSKVGNLAWPVDVKFWNENPSWFTKPHHDYPAADIPVPTGTTVFSITDGTVKYSNGGCGTGITVTSGDAVFTYCHGVPGTRVVQEGQQVSAGQELFTSDSTGHSTGPHLHVQIKIGNTKYCPQEMFRQMGSGITDIDLSKLPTSGCSY